MTRSELIALLAMENPHLLQKDVENIVTTIFGDIAKALKEGDRIELRGFGTFMTKIRKPRAGRNPKTGENVTVSEKKVPCFKAGKELRDRVNTHSKPSAPKI